MNNRLSLTIEQEQIMDHTPTLKTASQNMTSESISAERDTDMQSSYMDNSDDASQAEVPCDCCKHKHRETKEYRDLLNRLKRIEGQVRGIQGMVEEDRYCVDILTQVAAIQSALNSFNKVLLSNHIKTCVVEDIRNGQDEAVDELCATIQRLMK